MNKTLKIKKINQTKLPVPFHKLKEELQHLGWHDLSYANWSEYSYKPEVNFQIAHDGNHIFLHFRVLEDHVRGIHTKDFGDVWKDSCVEFFVSPGSDHYYYNFEFNCIESALLCYGENRVDRERAPQHVMEGLLRYSSIGNSKIEIQSPGFQWEILLAIPLKSLFRHNINQLSGKTMKANFYKCGDELNTPHFLSWAPVGTVKPDFHQPGFFREIAFE